MANVTANVIVTSVDVTNTPSNIVITEDSNFVANVVSTTTAVNVASTTNTINVAALASVANSAVRTAINVANVSGFGNLSYDNTISSNGVISYTGVSSAEIKGVIDNSAANVRKHISVSDNGGFGSLTYSNITGIIQYTGPTATEVRGTLSVTNVAGGDGSLSYDNLTGLFTYSGPDQAEANARIAAAPDQVRAHISATGNINYNSTTGVISESLTTDDIDEGTTNLYYTNARVSAWLNTEGGEAKPFDIWTGNSVLGFGDVHAEDGYFADITAAGGSGITINTDGAGGIGTTVIRSDKYESGVVRVNNAGGYPSIPAGNTFNILTLDRDLASNADAALGYLERHANGSYANTWQFTNDGGVYYPIPTNTDELAEGGTNLYYTSAKANSAISTYFGDSGNFPFNFNGRLTVNGNVDVSGNLNYENVTDLLVKDNKIVLNYGDVAKDAYIYVDNSNGGYRVPQETFELNSPAYAPPATPAPPYGYSAKFGSGAIFTIGTAPQPYIAVGNSADSQDANILPKTGTFTAEAWVYVPTYSGIGTKAHGTILSQQGKAGASDDANGFELRLNTQSQKVEFSVGNSSVYRADTGTLSAGAWHHIAVVKNNTGGLYNANLYVDGSYVQRLDGTEVGDIADSYLTIGNQSNDQGSNTTTYTNFHGSIDEVRLSSNIRYTGASFTVPSSAFTNDSATIALFHLDGNARDDNAVADPSIKWDKDFETWQISSDGNTYTNISTISNTIAGSGLTGGGTTGDITLNVGAGYGVTVNADDVEVNNSEIQALITGGTGISVTSGEVSLDNTAVSAGNYGSATQIPTFTVDAQGRLTAASNVTFSGAGSVTSVTAGDGLTQTGNANVNPTLNVGAGYGITVNADDVAFANSVLGTLTTDITTTGNITGDYVFATTRFEGDINGAIQAEVWNASGGTLNKGDIVALNGNNHGSTPDVELADYGNASLMPGFGVVKNSISPTATGEVVISGKMNFAGHGFTVGAQLYVNGAGQFTETPPQGEGNLVQKIATVTNSNTINVAGASRTNATPNLDDGNIFIGDSSNYPVTAVLDTSIVPENGNLYYTDARVDAHLSGGDGIDYSAGTISVDTTVIRTTGDQSITGNTSFIGTVDGGTNANLILNSLDTGDSVDSFIDLSPTRGATQAIIRAETAGDIVLDADFAIDIGAGNFGASSYNADITAHSINLDTSGGKLNIIGRNPVTSNVNITAPNFVGNLTGTADTVASLSGLTTDDLTQGSTNLYYANSLVTANLAALGANPISSTANITTTDSMITENLYTNYIQGNGNDPVIMQSATFRVDNQNFEIYNDASAGKFNSVDASDGSGGPDIDTSKARGGFGSESGVVGGDNIFNFIGRGWHPIAGGLYRPAAIMGFVVDPTYERDQFYSNGAANYLVKGEFRVSPDYKIANNPEFRIRNDSKVMIENDGVLHANNPELSGVVTVGNGSENRFTDVGNIELKIARANNAANATMGVTSWVNGAGTGLAANAVGIEFFTHYTGDLPDGTAVTLSNTAGVDSAIGNIASGTVLFTKSLGAGATGLHLFELYEDSGLTTVSDWNNYGGSVPQDEVGYTYGGTVEYAVTPNTAITSRDYTFTLNQTSEDLVLDTNGTDIATFYSNVDVDFNGTIRPEGVKLKQFSETVVALGNQSGDVSSSLNADNGSIYTLTATGGITINSIANAVAGTSMTIIITQDGTGSHTLTSSMKFAGGNKTLSTGGGDIDIISVFYDGTNYYASLTTDYQ